MSESLRGEPGRPGAEGRAGSEGRAGTTGETGRTGQAGMTGATGVQGVAGPSQTHKLLFLYVFTLAMFILLGIRSEVLSDRTQHNSDRLDRTAYAECTARAENVRRSNLLYDGLIDIERHNPFAQQGAAAAKTIERRIALYTDNKLVVPDCRKAP